MNIKAKLIKTGKDKYHIETDEFDGIHLSCYPHDITKQKLSLENCKMIENGYDLDELSDSVDFTRGFLKAIEILGDKKFTKEDMMESYYKGKNDGVEYEALTESGEFEDLDEMEKYEKENEDNFKKNLEQNEWDVEIETDPHHNSKFIDDDGKHSTIIVWKPKLDENDCLICKKETNI